MTEEVFWDKVVTQKLVKLGLSREHASIVVGEIAEHRQVAYSQGYKKGYNDAHNTKE